MPLYINYFNVLYYPWDCFYFYIEQNLFLDSKICSSKSLRIQLSSWMQYLLHTARYRQDNKIKYYILYSGELHLEISTVNTENYSEKLQWIELPKISLKDNEWIIGSNKYNFIWDFPVSTTILSTGFPRTANVYCLAASGRDLLQ